METFTASAYKMYSFSGFVNCASVASVCMNQQFNSTPAYIMNGTVGLHQTTW